ncbi:arginase, partial [Bacillus wiedmannii]
LGVTIFTAEDVRKQGIKSIMEKAIKILNNNTDAVHLTFDLDALDPEFAPGGGLAVPHGLSLDDTKEAIDMLRNNTNLVAAEFTEINPILDKDNITVNTTIE